MTIPFIKLLTLGALLISAACERKASGERSVGDPRAGGAPVSDDFRVKDAPFAAGTPLPPAVATAVERLAVELQDGETLWALSQCGCLTETRATLFKGFATARGPLPEVLMPAVREEVRNDPKLKVLLGLPEFLADPLKALFADDGDIADAVREGLSQKLAKAVGGKPLKDQLAFRFDGFFSPMNTRRDAFVLAEVAVRWNLVLATSPLWKGEAPLAFDSHALQLLETLRVFAEWKYLFGLDRNSADQKPYGGLTFDIDSPEPAPLRPFDPRHEPDAKRTVGGAYTVHYPEATSLELVVDVRETWTHDARRPRIHEHALAWHGAALAFGRLRADRRQASSGLYTGDTPLLPEDAQRLPLIFLPGLQGLLNGGFLDPEGRAVRNALDPGEPLSLRTLARLGRATLAWSVALEDLRSTGLAEEELTRLAEAPQKLKEALRLVILDIMKAESLRTPPPSLGIAEIAETITLIADAERRVLPSPLLRGVAVDAFHRLVAIRLVPVWKGTSAEVLAPADVLWTHAAASAIARYAPAEHEAPWLPALLQSLTERLGAREESP